MKHFLAPLALFATRATIPEPNAGNSAQGCADGGLYIISVRGTDEDRGIGVAGTTIGTQVQHLINGTKIVALDYPATLSNPSYVDSVVNGTKSLSQLISEHVKSCPNDKMAIMGYSQGAQVTLDTLCGSDEPLFDNTVGIASDEIKKHVVAVAIFGDPTYVPNVTYNKGNSTMEGVFARKNSDSCLKYADIISSWCDIGDVYCAGGNSVDVHSQYFDKYGTDIVKFIVDKATPQSSNVASSASPSGTAAPISSGQPSISTTSGSATTTATGTSEAANGLIMTSKWLHVALPLSLAALTLMG
ncbi:hypothetical protein E4U13_001264 [Claviceps humidiphila]|uniref:Acetylxylan esterase n=1 Tax=Claviceps humidiphila TaxID=1294629 RepID=A0A9P7Q3X4_9HYPO|nr:hypothetical protein E4U13_001264 [Claviceps humidiphila]